MPGPRNMKKKNKHTKKPRRSRSLDSRPPLVSDHASASDSRPTPEPPHTPPTFQPAANQPIHYDPYDEYDDDDSPIPEVFTKIPFIHDPGNGPRVRDARAFLASSFASPPSLDDPLCAEFAQEEVLQMLCSVLPAETAMIMWYNKSRRTARVCPACQRLYRLGDILPAHVSEEKDEHVQEPVSPYLYQEQELSGLCSSLCFVLAAFHFPEAIRSTWGRMAAELDDETWDMLDGPRQQNDMGLGMLLKMTRCHDLGLGQLFFPDLDIEQEPPSPDGVDSTAAASEADPVRRADLEAEESTGAPVLVHSSL